jgi:hemoglobin
MSLRTLITTLCLAAACGAASAQAPAAPDSLYRDLGGQSGVVRLMDDLWGRLISDPRTNAFFKDVKPDHFKAELVDQICELAGGPCRRRGPDMKKAHAGIDITKADFNTLVELLQDSMDAQGIDFSAQNRMLARLAPMHRDIINVP